MHVQICTQPSVGGLGLKGLCWHLKMMWSCLRHKSQLEILLMKLIFSPEIMYFYSAAISKLYIYLCGQPKVISTQVEPWRNGWTYLMSHGSMVELNLWTDELYECHETTATVPSSLAGRVCM